MNKYYAWQIFLGIMILAYENLDKSYPVRNLIIIFGFAIVSIYNIIAEMEIQNWGKKLRSSTKGGKK